MYRMVLVHPDHCQLQNILWREKNGSLQCIQIQTVTYGLRSSSFLATRCLVELARTEGKRYPLASKALLNNTYVDDILCGCDTIEETVKLKNELISLLKLRSFELHKWCSNNLQILNDIPKNKQNFDEINISKNDLTVKTLGLTYDTKTDNFKVSCPKVDINECVKKRQVLSFISKFYDPLGLVGPVLVAAKVIMQKLWLSKVKWDAIISSELLDTWKNFVESLMSMPTVTVQRNLNFTGALHIEIVGFCDSSLIAYGAVIYARTIFENKVHVNLICSKSRIVPINKKLTMPRLELNSALLLSKLSHKVFELLKDKVSKVFLYSDSNIVLAWIKSEPLKLNPYVANRIIKIQEMTSEFEWFYINTSRLSSNSLSRGLEPHEINSNNFWFNGPEILSNIEFLHFEIPFFTPDHLPEYKVVTLAKAKPEFFFIKFSSLTNFKK
uniref:Uncharacterized protein LOC114345585 n=1 Tax=Diabrotica virgifera virgifera TaxID=50390 RepID=A0A6P7GQL1_DIAVI